MLTVQNTIGKKWCFARLTSARVLPGLRTRRPWMGHRMIQAHYVSVLYSSTTLATSMQHTTFARESEISARHRGVGRGLRQTTRSYATRFVTGWWRWRATESYRTKSKPAIMERPVCSADLAQQAHPANSLSSCVRCDRPCAGVFSEDSFGLLRPRSHNFLR